MKGTPKQKLALAKLNDDFTKVVVYGGGAGGGKSFLGCFWLLTMCIAYPNTRWYIGREELKRIRQSTLISWSKVCSLLKFADYNINGQDNFIRLGNGSQIDLLDLQYQPRDPLYERFGSLEYTGGWIEEGSETNFGAFDVLKTRTGRHLNKELNLLSKTLITCNPKKCWIHTEFYKPYKNNELPLEHCFIPSLVTDNPFIAQDYIDNLKSTKDKAKKERLLYGNWDYEDNPAQLIDYESMLDYFANYHVKRTGKYYITADIARKGRDKTIVRLWDGLVCIKRKEMKVSKVTESAELIKDLAIEYKVPMSSVIVDEDGVGGGVMDILSCNGFVNNSRALFGENYVNLKSQCSFGMANLITAKEVSEVCNDTNVKKAVIEEMEQVKQANIDDDGKVAIISKEKIKEILGRSPDEWDSIMMRFWFELNNTSFFFG